MTIIPPEVVAHYEDMLAHLCAAAAVKVERRNPPRLPAEPAYVPPEDERLALVFGIAILRQGFAGEYAGDMIRRVQALRNELALRRLACVPGAGTMYGGKLAEAEALGMVNGL